MSKKTINFTADANGETVCMVYEVSEACTWGAQAYMFEKFLLAQGYVFEDGITGADVREYVEALEDAEDEF